MLLSSSTISRSAMSRLRQLEGETRAAARSALEQDAAAVSLHDVADDRQPEAGGAHLAVVELGEPLEDSFLTLGGNPGTGVAHRQAHDVVRAFRVDPHRAARRRVAD